MKGTEILIESIVNVLGTLSPGALRRVLAYAKREQTRVRKISERCSRKMELL